MALDDGFFVEAAKQLGILNIHLLNGEDYVADVFQKSDGTLVLKKPVRPNITIDERGRASVSLPPVSPFLEDDDIEIAADKVLWKGPVTKPMRDAYVKVTTGLEIANSIPTIPGTLLR